MSRLRSPLVAGLLTTLVLSILAGAHRYGWQIPAIGGFIERLERRTADLRFQLRGPESPGGEIVLVVFDDKTMEQDPTLFERREGWARVLAALREQGARVIGIDAMFADPERLLSGELVESIDRYLDSEAGKSIGDEPARLLRRVQHESHGDDHLAEAIREAGNVVLAMHLGYHGAGGEMEDADIRKGRFGQTVPGPYGPAEVEGVVASLPLFDRVAKALGTITVFEDETHTIREMPMVFAYHDRLYAPLALQLVARFEGISRGRIAYLGTDNTIRMGKRTLQLNERNGFYLNFRGPEGTFPTYPVIDLVSGQLPGDRFRDRIVLLGITQFGHDRAMTPYGDVVPAVEIQATAIDNILAGDPVRRAPPWVDFLTCLAMGLIISLLFWQRLELSPWLQALGMVAALVVYLGVTHALFTASGLWLFWVGPIGVCVLTGGVCLALSYFGEGLARRRVRHAFGHYLSDNVIHQLLEEPGKLTLGGERRELTALFSDIRGFTNISERIDPEELVSLLNTYFTPMTREVLARGGFLDKYIGDALMAVFGAPVTNPDHPVNALACALGMHAELDRLRPVLQQHGGGIDIGVGVNTGEMVVGNMGSEERFDYTVVGDAVNLASRLEGLTKVYGVFCLVGDRTRELASEGYVLREVDRVQVKGKSEAAAIHELVSGPGRTIATYADLPTFERGLSAFRSGEFKASREAFADFGGNNPADKVCRLYLERLDELGEHPPDGWTGISVFLTK